MDLPEGGRIRLEGQHYKGPPRKRALACRCQVLGPERVDCERMTLQSSLNCLNSECQMELHADLWQKRDVLPTRGMD